VNRTFFMRVFLMPYGNVQVRVSAVKRILPTLPHMQREGSYSSGTPQNVL
jgi:hypothetical protein